jgi:hypothetical protein
MPGIHVHDDWWVHQVAEEHVGLLPKNIVFQTGQDEGIALVVAVTTSEDALQACWAHEQACGHA